MGRARRQQPIAPTPRRARAARPEARAPAASGAGLCINTQSLSQSLPPPAGRLAATHAAREIARRRRRPVVPARMLCGVLAWLESAKPFTCSDHNRGYYDSASRRGKCRCSGGAGATGAGVLRAPYNCQNQTGWTRGSKRRAVAKLGAGRGAAERNATSRRRAGLGVVVWRADNREPAQPPRAGAEARMGGRPIGRRGAGHAGAAAPGCSRGTWLAPRPAGCGLGALGPSASAACGAGGRGRAAWEGAAYHKGEGPGVAQGHGWRFKTRRGARPAPGWPGSGARVR
jgi:hypothetical protein